jgi:hypothetical protein
VDDHEIADELRDIVEQHDSYSDCNTAQLDTHDGPHFIIEKPDGARFLVTVTQIEEGA